jgi:hypothetical protein
MKTAFEMESLHHHHRHPPSSKALKWSRLYKWFLLVVALVVLSAIRYYHWSVDEKISADQAETTVPKQQHKTTRVEEENVHSPKSETDEKVVSNDEDANKSHGDSHDKPDAPLKEKTSLREPKDDSIIIDSKNETSKKKKTKTSHGSSEHEHRSKHQDERTTKPSATTNRTDSATTTITTTPTSMPPTVERIQKNSTNETANVVDKKNETVLTTTTTTIPDISNTNLHDINNTNTRTNTTALSSIRLIPPYDKTKAEIFTNDSCILTNTEEWFPSSTNNEWQLRAPRFMILGAQDSGTRLLANNLVKPQHSSILSNGHVNQQVAYFAQPSFLRTQPQQQRIHVWKARQRMYAKDYPTKVLQQNSSRITMDATPDYLFYDHALSTRILCVCPWVQMLVILRNPADRVYASFRRASSQLGWKGTLEQYVRLDMETMERAGLIGPEKLANQQQQDAWKSYVSLTVDGPVGRGFYALQLQEWFQALRKMGRDVKQAIRVIRYEEYKARPIWNMLASMCD